MTGNGSKRRGFVLAEVILVLILSSAVVLTLLAGLVALVRGSQPPSLVVAGETLPVAPGFGAFPSAVRLHQVFADRLSSARAAYVFGGTHLSIPAAAAVRSLKPLKAQALPLIPDFASGLPMNANAFYDAYAAALGEQELTGSVEDFTIALVGPVNGLLAVSCLVQVRRRDVLMADGPVSVAYTVREVKLWDAADPIVQRYCFAERPEASAGIFIGAVHTWMRFGSNLPGNEEGPTCIVFPDPWIYGGSRGRLDDIPPFSRFSYFVAVSP